MFRSSLSRSLFKNRSFHHILCFHTVHRYHILCLFTVHPYPVHPVFFFCSSTVHSYSILYLMFIHISYFYFSSLLIILPLIYIFLYLFFILWSTLSIFLKTRPLNTDKFKFISLWLYSFEVLTVSLLCIKLCLSQIRRILFCILPRNKETFKYQMIKIMTKKQQYLTRIGKN